MTEDFGFDGNFYDDEDGKHFVCNILNMNELSNRFIYAM